MSDKAPLWLLILGWVFALLGGLFGIFIGTYLISAKIVGFNGEKIFRYNGSARLQGLFMALLGLTMFIGWTFYFFCRQIKFARVVTSPPLTGAFSRGK